MISNVFLLTVLYLLPSLVSGKVGSCELKHRLRDKWFFKDQSKHTFIRIRKQAIQFRADRNHKIRYKCVENRGNIYLLRKNRYIRGKDALLCIGFSYIADNPYAEFSLIRLMAPGQSSHIMSPRLIPRGTDVNIDNSCEFLQGTNRRHSTFIKRRKPGCKFPVKLFGEWNYTYRHARHLTFGSRNMTLELLNGERYVFNCESRDRKHYVVRIVGYKGTDDDAVMCMRLTPLEKNRFYDYELSRTNNGQELDGKLMIVPRGRRIYLHSDCEWIDSPARPEYLYPR